MAFANDIIWSICENVVDLRIVVTMSELNKEWYDIIQEFIQHLIRDSYAYCDAMRMVVDLKLIKRTTIQRHLSERHISWKKCAALHIINKSQTCHARTKRVFHARIVRRVVFIVMCIKYTNITLARTAD